MSKAPVILQWQVYDRYTRPMKVIRESIGRALIPGYRWRDPVTGRFVRKVLR